MRIDLIANQSSTGLGDLTVYIQKELPAKTINFTLGD